MTAEPRQRDDLKTATFAAGCFWGVEAAFRQTPGVIATTVGFCGGQAASPTYRQVCAGGTGHAESVEVVYDPDQVSYEELLEVFWGCHDPTQVDRQGPDVGSQYRSVIFFHDDRQRAAAEASRERLEESGRLRGPLATRIEPASDFWRAEDYHQRYLEKLGRSHPGPTVTSD
jgi:peptide-methionine (S)-S-oxide reductase